MTFTPAFHEGLVLRNEILPLLAILLLAWRNDRISGIPLHMSDCFGALEAHMERDPIDGSGRDCGKISRPCRARYGTVTEFWQMDELFLVKF